jgi:indole-3-glycerol phosphate synthase
MTILDEILATKREEVAAAKQVISVEAMAESAAEVEEPTRGFAQALAAQTGAAVIAEVKRRSPSKGLIRADFDAVECARAYDRGGATCLSVLTDEKYFGGELAFLPRIREAVPQPLLRKEFVVDTYQIDEARTAGADAILLIVSALSSDELGAFDTYARGLELDVLVEVHNEAELETALELGVRLLGVNNRDLKTFDTDLAVTERLAGVLSGDARAESVLLVAESGIYTHEDVLRLEQVGAKAFLVGESLMREDDVTAALMRLRGAA